MRVGSLETLSGSGYGMLLQPKLLAAVALSVFGWWHRHLRPSRTVRRRRHPNVHRFATVELAVITIALAVALGSAHAPRSTIDGEVTAARVLLGYPMPEQ